MKNLQEYTQIEELLSDETFRSWVREKEHSEIWEAWSLDNISRQNLVEEARNILLAMKVPSNSITNNEIGQELEQTWNKIESIELLKANQRVIWKNTWFKASAAVFLICLGILFYYRYSIFEPPTSIGYSELIHRDGDGMIEQTNNTDKSQLIMLSDGSSVLLLPKSKLSYPKVFSADGRKVYLSGEGFFEISKDPSNPFYVYSNELVTKVYGTSFRIKAYSNQSNVSVLVHTGKVKVSSSNYLKTKVKEEMVLLPNEGVVYVRNKMVFEKITYVPKDKLQSIEYTPQNIEELNFEFYDVQVGEIFDTIEKGYQIKIDYPKDKLKDCYLTTSLSDEPLPEKLKILCESLGANTKYEMVGNTVKIISSGCE